MLTLSKRLQSIADMVKPCICMADIGTDHGYIPVYLCQNNIVQMAVAGDVSKGSAYKARENVTKYGLQDRISTRCGNGLKIIEDNDNVECVVIAGMGGMLMLDILSDSALPDTIKQLVLQPQRDLPFVRRHIHKMQFEIADEAMVFEEGKYYNIISATKKDCICEYTPLEYEFGKILLESGNKVLKQQLEFQVLKLAELLPRVNNERVIEIEQQLNLYKEALKCL